MMKKYFFTLVIAVITGFSLNAQCNIDFSITDAGIFPDSSYDYMWGADTLIGLKAVDPGVAYESVIQFMVPTDTLYSLTPGSPPMTIPINNITLDGVQNLPAGLTYDCNPGTCVFNGGSNGCVKISGTVAEADTGIYRLTLNTTANVMFSGTNLPMPTDDSSFVLVVGNVTMPPSSSINTPVTIVKHLEVFPNPLAEEGTISFYVSQSTNVEVRVVDMIGNMIYTESLRNVSGVQNLGVNSSDFSNGVYFISVTNGKDTMTKKVMINK